MDIRPIVALLLASVPAYAGATWNVVMLHPGGAKISETYDGFAGTQVGVVFLTDTDVHAALWNKTAASFVDLNPVGGEYSSASAATETKQYGKAEIGGIGHAGMWSGTAASWVDLHPAGAEYSVINAADGNI